MIFLGGFLICAGLIAAALFFQYVMGIGPCPLCIFQRIFVIITGLILLAGAWHNPGIIGRRVYGGLTALAAALGAGVAGRHVWIQSLPFDQQPGCGYSLNDMLETFPLLKTLKLVLEGSGGCGDVLWSFLGISMPGWVLLFFLGFVLMGLLLIFSRLGRR
ncbi:MAG: disulfide bond formation protein B [Gammaproteobacteria bacterium]|nr:disulfide bond formation protein B [Gammaproteobacteria bacterium]